MKKPIRILHVLAAMNRAGTETILMNIFRNIDRNTVVFDFVVCTQEKCDYDDEIASLGGKSFRVQDTMGRIILNIKNGGGIFSKNMMNIK